MIVYIMNRFYHILWQLLTIDESQETALYGEISDIITLLGQLLRSNILWGSLTFLMMKNDIRALGYTSISDSETTSICLPHTLSVTFPQAGASGGEIMSQAHYIVCMSISD